MQSFPQASPETPQQTTELFDSIAVHGNIKDQPKGSCESELIFFLNSPVSLFTVGSSFENHFTAVSRHPHDKITPKTACLEVKLSECINSFYCRYITRGTNMGEFGIQTATIISSLKTIFNGYQHLETADRSLCISAKSFLILTG